MRLMSFAVQGRTSFGLAVDQGVIDAGRQLGGARSLRDTLLADSLPALRKLRIGNSNRLPPASRCAESMLCPSAVGG